MSSDTEEFILEVDEYSSQEELDAALIACAARGTYPEAKRLLNLGAKADVLVYDAKKKGSRSALGNATWRGHYQLVKLFLERGADPNVNDDLTWRPLTEAISTDDMRMVKMLLEYGADPNEEIGWELQTPMHAAMSGRCSNPEIVRLLLEHGVDPNVEHHDYLMPLHYMAHHGGGPAEYDKLKVLLEEGHDVYIAPKDEFGHTPLEVAIREGNRETLDNMLRFEMLRELDNHRWLHVAAERGDKEMIKYLVKERECEINGLCRGATPLQVALDNNAAHVVEWLTKHGGQVAPPDSKSRCACQEDSDGD